MKREIRFYHPLPKFPSVSITGKNCLLNCAHCRGIYLHSMPDVSSPDKLTEFCVEHEKKGGVGVLISGGSSLDGGVPLDPFIKSITWIKENTGLILNLHTGVVDESRAEKIASTGVDIVSVDLVGSRETLLRVYGLDHSVESYLDTLSYLDAAGVSNLAPHITIGLDYGKIKGEYRALDYAASFDPEVLVFLGLIPTKGTPMENVVPPDVEEFVKMIEAGKRKMPETSVSLGCMRDRKDKHKMEWRAIQAGVDRIASSSRLTENKAENEGYKVKIIEGCCAIPKAYEEKLGLVP